MNKFLQVFAFSAIVLIVFSCKKNKDEVYDLYITINGTPVILHQATCRLAPDSLNPAHTAFRMTAYAYDSSKALIVDINKDDIDFDPGIYTSGNAGYTVMVSYYTDFNTPGMKIYNLANASGKPASLYEITITDINAKFIKGTIAGNYLTDKSSGADKTVEITNGDFYALRVY